MKSISRYVMALLALVAALSALSIDAHAQWKKTVPFLLSVANGAQAIQYKDGLVWAASGNMRVSSDSGKTWAFVPNFPAGQTIFDISFFDRKNGIVATEGNIWRTTDGGASWRSIKTGMFWKASYYGSPLKIVALETSGIFDWTNDGGATWSNQDLGNVDSRAFAIGIDQTIYAIASDNVGGVYQASILRSIDGGSNWTSGTQTIDGDCFSICADSCDASKLYTVNEEFNVATDGKAQFYLSTDGGSTFTVTEQRKTPSLSGAMATTRRAIFLGSVDSGIYRSLDKGLTWTNIGGPPLLDDTRAIAPIDDNHVVVIDKDGSCWTTDNSGGFAVPGSSCCSVATQLSLSTEDERTDTVGGTVAVPIELSGLTQAESVQVAMHYDLPNIDYIGTTDISGATADVPGEASTGRALLRFPNAQPNQVLGFAHFNVFGDTLVTPHVTFDSLQVLSDVAQCKYLLPPAATSIITPPAGCGEHILSELTHFGIGPTVNIRPLTENSEIAITATSNIGEATIAAYDLAGRECLRTTVQLSANTERHISLPSPSGCYLIEIRWSTGRKLASVILAP